MIFQKFSIVMIALILSACSTFNGGMPNLPYNTEEELAIVKDALKSDASVKSFYDAPTVERRNRFIASRLLITNIEYLKFIKAMSVEESQIHSASEILVLSLDVASTAFTPVKTKTILSALSSITGGTRLSIDKNVFMEKSMSALVSAMNAQRKEVLTRLIKGSALDLNGYSFEQALSDTNDYYLAGTFHGAFTAIQKDASVKEEKAEAVIQFEMKKRNPQFLDAVVKARVESLLSQVDALSDETLFGLIKAPPVTDGFIDSVVAARDPSNLRNSDKKAAVAILKMRIVLSERDDKNLSAWEAAVKAVAK